MNRNRKVNPGNCVPRELKIKGSPTADFSFRSVSVRHFTNQNFHDKTGQTITQLTEVRKIVESIPNQDKGQWLNFFGQIKN